MNKLTLLLGGARSGKSTYAEGLAKKQSGKVLYIATAEALDPEMVERIEKHKSQRPGQWQTLEVPSNIGSVVNSQIENTDLILLDCLTLLISNVILAACGSLDDPDEAEATQAVEIELEQIIQAINNSKADWIIVSNEVGMGLVPPYPIGRVYRDLLGWANRQVAAIADEVYLMVAGICLPLHQLGRSFEEDLE